MKKYIDGKFWYDDENHTYGLGDEPLGGFTEVFKSLGLIETSFYTDEGKDRGQSVHLLCQAYDEGHEIDESKIQDARTLARFQAYKRFRAETGFRPDRIERPSHNAHLGIACTPDRTGVLSSVTVTIDLKGGAKQKWHSYQTAFQNLCLYENYASYPRYALYLKDSGRYKLDPHTDPYDFEIARAAAVVYWAKRNSK